jgi:hypothetical protein
MLKQNPCPDASDYPAVIARAKKDNRLIILHSGINVYTVTALQLDRAKKNVEVQLNKLDSLHIVKIANPNSNQEVSDKSGTSPREVHLYMKDSISYLLEEPYTIPLEKVARVDVVGKG